jgi:hypothetical protein
MISAILLFLSFTNKAAMASGNNDDKKYFDYGKTKL